LRPIRRNNSPIADDFDNYTSAKPYLISRIGSYCSYCERKIVTNLAVEHIEPKDGEYGKPQLKGCWTNFLLACVNCNSTKGDKQLVLSNVFLPDRDNTFFAFNYLADGKILPADNLSPEDSEKANNILSLIGLDKPGQDIYNDKNELIAQDRVSQRSQIWGAAESALDDFLANENNNAVKKLIVKNMIFSGFFSVWMTVFKDHPNMKKRFIKAMNGTEESGCFNMLTVDVVSPHPNGDKLLAGGKI